MKANVHCSDHSIADTSPPAANPVSPDDAQPGALRGVVTLTLETRQAQRLVRGRPGTAGKPAIIGLLGFAHRLRPIWKAAMTDDPYADGWLIKIHDALEVADEVLKASLSAVQSRLVISEAISATPGASSNPVCTSLRFSNPYAYRGAHRLADYDRLARAVLTAQHIGVMTRDAAEHALALGGRQLRRAFLSPLGYRFTGITRQDVWQRTAKKAQAQASMGEIPANVLAGTLRAPHAPLRSVPSAVRTEHEGLRSLPLKP